MRRRRQSTIAVVFELAGSSADAERWIATGWREARLSTAGKRQAVELGERRAGDELDVVFCSDLPAAAETARIAFASRGRRVLHDWRLRDCDFGNLTGEPIAAVEKIRSQHVYEAFPGGESYADVAARVRSFVRDLRPLGAHHRILVVGHPATKIALDHVLEGAALTDLVATPQRWQPGWVYSLAIDT